MVEISFDNEATRQSRNMTRTRLPPPSLTNEPTNSTLSDDSQHLIMAVKVVAPASLEAGYTFEASVEGRTFTVTVPDKGVEEGQEFEVPYPFGDNGGEEKSNLEKTGNKMDRSLLEDPHSEWRTKLCSCCDVITQATCWIGCICPSVLIANIITRFKLNWKGQKGTEEEAAMAYNKIVFTLLGTLFVWWIPILGTFAAIGFYFFVTYIGMHTRSYMRKKYDIPATCCKSCDGAMDDCCCTFFCGCCTSIQMARHTHDDKEYPGYCCTSTGLELGAPEIV